jgi:cytochrome b pre-mRNA-processing protein 3
MIFNLFRRAPRDDTIAGLYGAIVAQARSPAFYRSYGVPDTVNGRFELILLHAVLLVSRLEAEDGQVRHLGQAVFDHFCSDMDANLREMGVGDIAVPRKMKAIGEAFYGRKRAYESAMAAPGLDALAAALVRNVGTSPETGRRLATYVRNAAGRLAALNGNALGRGEIVFADPEAVAQPAGAP